MRHPRRVPTSTENAVNPLTSFVVAAGTALAAIAAIVGWDVSALIKQWTEHADKIWPAALLVIAFVKGLPTSVAGIKAALLNQADSETKS